jgi:16S rRNA pseudouridine516 synthase
MRRIDQILASLGYGSRREVRGWIEAGRVTIRGAATRDPGEKADPRDLRIDGEPPDHPEELLILLNKPAGRVCSHSPGEGASVYELIPERWRRRNPPVTSIGRLDKDTTGLLLLTDLSPLVHRLTSPKHKVPKVYRVRLDRDIPAGIEDVFLSGTLLLEDEETPCAPATLERIGSREAEVTVTEGRYHQIKRMFAGQGCQVIDLHRMRFGSLALGNLALGSWIELPINSLDSL